MNKFKKRLLSASMAAIMTLSSAGAAQLALSVTAFANYGQDKINDTNEYTQTCFNAISAAVKDIAAGTRESTVVTVEFDPGIAYDGINFPIDTATILNALLIEYPYEMYWFNKTAGMETNSSGYSDNTGRFLKTVNFSFYVAEAYKGSEDFTVNTANTTAAAAASTAARAAHRRAVLRQQLQPLTVRKRPGRTLQAISQSSPRAKTRPLN